MSLKIVTKSVTSIIPCSFLSTEYSESVLLLLAVEVLFAAEAWETREALAEIFSFSNFSLLCECSVFGKGNKFQEVPPGKKVGFLDCSFLVRQMKVLCILCYYHTS